MEVERCLSVGKVYREIFLNHVELFRALQRFVIANCLWGIKLNCAKSRRKVLHCWKANPGVWCEDSHVNCLTDGGKVHGKTIVAKEEKRSIWIGWKVKGFPFLPFCVEISILSSKSSIPVTICCEFFFHAKNFVYRTFPANTNSLLLGGWWGHTEIYQ